MDVWGPGSVRAGINGDLINGLVISPTYKWSILGQRSTPGSRYMGKWKMSFMGYNLITYKWLVYWDDITH